MTDSEFMDQVAVRVIGGLVEVYGIKWRPEHGDEHMPYHVMAREAQRLAEEALDYRNRSMCVR